MPCASTSTLTRCHECRLNLENPQNWCHKVFTWPQQPSPHLISVMPLLPGWVHRGGWAARLGVAAPPPRWNTGGTWWPWDPVSHPLRSPGGCRWTPPWRQSRVHTVEGDYFRFKANNYLKLMIKVPLLSKNWFRLVTSLECFTGQNDGLVKFILTFICPRGCDKKERVHTSKGLNGRWIRAMNLHRQPRQDSPAQEDRLLQHKPAPVAQLSARLWGLQAGPS